MLLTKPAVSFKSKPVTGFTDKEVIDKEVDIDWLAMLFVYHH